VSNRTNRINETRCLRFDLLLLVRVVASTQRFSLRIWTNKIVLTTWNTQPVQIRSKTHYKPYQLKQASSRGFVFKTGEVVMSRRLQFAAKHLKVCCGVGIPCPRCDQPSVKYKHKPGWTPRTGRGWFDHWYICRNSNCDTSTFFDGGFHPAVKSRPAAKATAGASSVALRPIIYDDNEVPW